MLIVVFNCRFLGKRPLGHSLEQRMRRHLGQRIDSNRTVTRDDLAILMHRTTGISIENRQPPEHRLDKPGPSRSRHHSNKIIDMKQSPFYRQMVSIPV